MNIRITIGIAIICSIVVGIRIYDAGFRMHEPLLAVLQHTKPNFHTPAFPSGHYLPAHITGQLRIDPSMGVIILGGTTTVEKNSELVIEPGTTIAAHEYASLIIQGTMRAEGTPEQPIRFISNELREENRTWAGIMFTDGSTGTISNAIFHHASPGVSCETRTDTSITETAFSLGNLDVFGPCHTVQDTTDTIQ